MHEGKFSIGILSLLIQSDTSHSYTKSILDILDVYNTKEILHSWIPQEICLCFIEVHFTLLQIFLSLTPLFITE